MNFVYHVPTKMIFGCGALKTLHEYDLPGKKALIVITADNSMRTYGYLDMLTHELDLANVTYVVYDKITPNPEVKNIDEAANICKQEKCDFVIGLGGGSSMDGAKGIALAAVNPEPFWTYSTTQKGGKKALDVVNPLPTVEVTTTAATGSEVDPWFVISNNEANEKTAFGDDGINHPTIAVIDPELMLSIPAKPTAYQGFDIIYHAVESYINVNSHKMSRMYAVEATKLAFEYLPKCVANGKDKEARENICLASSLAAFQMRCLNLHNMEHVLSAFHPTLPHGAGLIILSNAYFKNLIDSHAADEDFKYLAKVVGKKGDDPNEFLDAMNELMKQCGVDDIKMSDYGINEDELELFSKSVFNMTGNNRRDPIDLTEKDFLKIYKESFK